MAKAVKKKSTKKSKNKKSANSKSYLFICIVLVISIFSLASLTLDSYALWFQTKNQANKNLITTGCFNISFNDLDKDGKSTSIKLLNSYPIKEERGVKLKPYTFTLKNICNIKGEYRIVLSKLDNSTLDDNYIRYTFNEIDKAIEVMALPLESNTTIDSNTKKIIDEMNNPKKIVNSYVLEEGTIDPDESKTFNFRLWLDYEAGNDQMEKEFEGVISISSISVH